MGASSAGEALMLTALLAGRYLSAHTGDPGDTGTNEVAGGGYARKAAGTWTQTGANPTEATNDDQIDFDLANALWGDVSHFGVWSASSGGTFYGFGVLDVAKTIDEDDILRFPAGSLTIGLD